MRYAKNVPRMIRTNKHRISHRTANRIVLATLARRRMLSKGKPLRQPALPTDETRRQSADCLVCLLCPLLCPPSIKSGHNLWYYVVFANSWSTVQVVDYRTQSHYVALHQDAVTTAVNRRLLGSNPT